MDSAEGIKLSFSAHPLCMSFGANGFGVTEHGRSVKQHCWFPFLSGKEGEVGTGVHLPDSWLKPSLGS
jgi:hypothetical protein